MASRMKRLSSVLRSGVGAMVAAGCAGAPSGVHVRGSDRIKVGVIGCGSRGRGAASQAVEAAANVQVTALADLFPEAIDTALRVWADRPRELYDIPRTRCFTGFQAYRELLATDVDYVILAAPPGFRPMHLAAAIDAGKHVYAEKSIAVDPVGVKTIIAAAQRAREKKLGIVAGTWRRHERGYQETVKRIRGGAIGQIVSADVYCLHYGFEIVQRKAGWSDVEWQIRNFPYFTWLSGDFIVEHHLHQHDIVKWVLGQNPARCIGMGGRMWRTGEVHGNIYDHFAVDYKFDGGVNVHSFCRQFAGGFGRVAEHFQGTRGWADASGMIRAEGKPVWKYKGERNNFWIQMHADLINSVRAGDPINEGVESAEGHLASIMGRMSAYSGQCVRWADAMASTMDLMPRNLGFGPLAVAPVAVPGR